MFSLLALYYYLRNTHLRREFPRRLGERCLRRHLWESTAFGGGERKKKLGRQLTPPPVAIKKKKNWCACGAPIIILYSFTAAFGGGFPNGHRRRPNGGAEGAQRWRQGATPPEREGNREFNI